MNYRTFVSNFKYRWNKKIVLIKGGSTYVRDDVLLLLKKRFSRDNDLVLSSTDIADVRDPYDLLYDSPKNFRVINWSEYRMPKHSLKMWLIKLEDVKTTFVIVDPHSFVYEAFMDVYPKQSAGMVIDCDPRTSEMFDLIRARLNLVSGITIDDDVVRYLATDVPYDTLFDVFHSLEAIQLDNVSMSDIRRYGLSKVDLEGWLCDCLLKLGRRKVLQYSLTGVNARKFLRFLVYRLTLLIQVSTLRGGKAVKNAQSLDLPLSGYFECVDMAKKLNLKDLYRRLYLTYSLMKWQEHPGALLLLLMYW